jgi:hypothetical protein
MTTDTWPKWTETHSALADTNLREVAPRLFVGSLLAAALDGPWSARVDLTYDGVPDPDNPDAPYLHVGIHDGEWYRAHQLDAIAAFVRLALNVHSNPTLHARTRVIVHCAAGVSRSPSVAYGLLRVIFGLDHETAFQRVLARLPMHPPMPDTLCSVRDWADVRCIQAGNT